MDRKIQRLIDGASELARHFASENRHYWLFPKEYIEKNNYLQSFLENNKDVEVITLLKKQYPQIQLYEEFYKTPIVKISNKEYMVHDYLRYILYNYCVFNISKDLLLYCSNVRNTSGLRMEGDSNKRFSYPYSEEHILKERFLKGIQYPLSIKNLISRGSHIKYFLHERQFLNLGHIETLVKYANETYDFTELKIK